MMSGFFQRIARRRGERSDAAAAPAEADRPPAATPPKRYIGAPAASPPTRYIGAPAEPEQRGGDAAAGAAAHAGQSTAEVPAVADQPTELIPAIDASHRPSPAAAEPPAAGAGAPAEQVAAATGEAGSPPEATGEESDGAAPVERGPGFRERGRMRRRLRYLRRLRELQIRDLGGLAFDLRRFERKRDDLVAQKVDQIRACDDEIAALEAALDERRELRDVRAAGIGGSCPRCLALYGSGDRFCSRCGAALAGQAQGPAQIAAPPPPAPPPAGLPPEQVPPQ